MTESAPLTNQQKIQLALNCWYITGATASGKSATSIQFAKQIDAEIVSLDSMAIYRGMDIGTAKPTIEQRKQVPHHLIDILDPSQLFSVNQYRDMAITAIQEIQQRGKQVVFVGGSALYLKAMLRGVFDGPPADPEFRDAIEQELETVELAELHKRLQLVDPISAEKLHPNDKRRIIRALEVYRVAGQPISHLQNEFETAHSPDECKVFTLRHQRDVLHARIEKRVNWMFDHGLVDEVKSLIERHGELGKTASQAVGYREVIEHLCGEGDLDDVRNLVLYRTRQFARHQETWFRGLAECRMIDLSADIDDSQIAPTVVQAMTMATDPK